ncbi:hypothetical protein LBMAG56_46850 [Verrucomicrobiota bacterium]|nr:hypothetical protein LBMAG56_46850 [Verrucomicrobiota bacterium]
MSDNAKITRPGLILALLLTAAAGSAAELPAAALTSESLAARFASLRFELRAELQAPRPAVAPRPPQPAVAAVVTTPSAPRLAANF